MISGFYKLSLVFALYVPLAQGFEIDTVHRINNACVACHAVIGFEQTGPSLHNIQKVYKKNYSNENEFVDAVTSFLKKPTIESSLFKEHVKKYGLMPLVGLVSEDLTAISEYLFHANLNDFSVHLNQSQILETPFAKGQRVAQLARSQLGQNLMGALQDKGVLGAVNFCHLNAQEITKNQAGKAMVIKRVSDRPRNLVNKANQKELKIIKSYQNSIAKGEELKSILLQEKNIFRFYAPIKINQMCLQCHGQKNIEIKPDTYVMIKSKYPKDRAFSYKDGDLRGIWSLEWK